MKVKYFVWILLAMQCVVGVSTRHEIRVSCCLQTSKIKIRITEMLNYLLQNAPPCRIKAVRFLLKNGKTLCSDPEDSWTQCAMKKLDKINRTAPNNSPSRTFASWTETTSMTTTTENSMATTTPRRASHTERRVSHTNQDEPEGEPKGECTEEKAKIPWTLRCLKKKTRHGSPVSCCLQTSKIKIRITDMLNYLLQNRPPCPIKAVRFLLKNGKTLCSDPEDSWTQHAIKELDKRKNTNAPNTSPSRTFASWTETTSSTSSPEASTESTITMTTPKGTSITWTPRTSITSRPLNKQPLGTTSKPSHWTPTLCPTSNETILLTSKQSGTTTKFSLWTTAQRTTKRSLNERKSTSRTPNNTSASLTTGNRKESMITHTPILETNQYPESAVTITESIPSATQTNHTTSMSEFPLKIKMQKKKKESDENRKQKITVTSQKAEKEREVYEWTEHFCQWSEIQETRYCTFY
ncbi:mucin-5AC-like isoform X2 [Neoarius graeffei]|uniref:mucin-5AC-like isoform X2 n=1 Tax=Neoarius graeffei TaxID=443677 RepID=UPI00298C3846|nr:mucin-5AC-like isoform X2 [Neoarius graeffei]